MIFTTLVYTPKYKYKINGLDIPVVSQINDLRIVMSNDLSFNSHINLICVTVYL